MENQTLELINKYTKEIERLEAELSVETNKRLIKKIKLNIDANRKFIKILKETL